MYIRQPRLSTLANTEQGFGEFYVDASVATPSVNVLCANASASELEPIVFGTWPTGNETFHKDPDSYPFKNIQNSTVLDKIFGWGPERPPPIFSVLPIIYNTVFSHNSNTTDALYVLAAINGTEKPDSDDRQDANYMVCGLSTTLEAGCSTQLHSTFGGNRLSANCKSDNTRAYKSTSTQLGQRLKSWVLIAIDWGFTLSLDGGSDNANTATARLLTQLIPTAPTLSTTTPSIAEALAIFAGCTLLQAALGAPPTEAFHFSDADLLEPDSSTQLLEPAPTTFPAWVQMADYASGAAAQWQGIFYVILTAVFLLAAWCLIYFARSVRAGRMVTDFVEPPNLFALALGSPSSAHLDGACGVGPEGGQFKVPWLIRTDAHGHVVIGDQETVRVMQKHSVYEGSLRGVGSTPDVGGRTPEIARMDVEDGSPANGSGNGQRYSAMRRLGMGRRKWNLIPESGA